jgi:hypothetical protein
MQSVRHLWLQSLFVGLLASVAQAQSPYTAEAYWAETTRPAYVAIKEKEAAGKELTADEKTYKADFETFLQSFYDRLPDEEKARYEAIREERGTLTPRPYGTETEADFEWRGRDRFLNFLFGAYYGSALVSLANIDNAAVAGLPLATGGLWMLGPAVNPAKYEGISQTTIRASNSGKTLGLGYGAALGLALGGEREERQDRVLFLSSVGSITLGEMGFQWQKRHNITDGRIELMRHYGFLGPAVALSLITATGTEDRSLIGMSLFGGGLAGLAVGNSMAKKYDYTRGDVDAINSLAILSTGLGLAFVIRELDNNSNASPSLILVPAAGAVVGTLAGQRSVKHVRLTRKQGSTINLTTSGAALLGIGILAMADYREPYASVWAPTVLGFAAHQWLFHTYKRANLAAVMPRGDGLRRKKNYSLATRFNPENYFSNKLIGTRPSVDPRVPLAQPVLSITLRVH